MTHNVLPANSVKLVSSVPIDAGVGEETAPADDTEYNWYNAPAKVLNQWLSPIKTLASLFVADWYDTGEFDELLAHWQGEKSEGNDISEPTLIAGLYDMLLLSGIVFHPLCYGECVRKDGSNAGRCVERKNLFSIWERYLRINYCRNRRVDVYNKGVHFDPKYSPSFKVMKDVSQSPKSITATKLATIKNLAVVFSDNIPDKVMFMIAVGALSNESHYSSYYVPHFDNPLINVELRESVNKEYDAFEIIRGIDLERLFNDMLSSEESDLKILISMSRLCMDVLTAALLCSNKERGARGKAGLDEVTSELMYSSVFQTS